MEKVVIIGSGLSGLACSYYLNKKGITTKLFEKNNYLGGRVNSEFDGNNIYDIGFQVLLDNYSQVKSIINYKSLKLNYFNSGASILSQNSILNLYNPLFHPFLSLSSNYNQIFTFSDYYKLINTLIFLRKNQNISAKKFLKNTFSNRSIELFFKPFFSGVFLDDELENELIFFLKLLRKFTFGKAGIPEQGMAELPKSIYNKCNKTKLYLNSDLYKLKNNKAYFKNGHIENFDKIILAMPINKINNIIDLNIKASYNSNTTCYFSTNKIIKSKNILLVADRSYQINSIHFLSNISKTYSKLKGTYFSISCNKADIDKEQIIMECKKILDIKDDIVFHKTYSIKNALHKQKMKINNKENIYFCGDWSEEPSIDGALKSGRDIANKILDF